MLSQMPGTQLDKILPALLAVKKSLKGVAKGTNNPFFKSKYADLNAYLDEVEPLLEANGLLLLQPVTTMYLGNGDSANAVTSRIYHAESGQYVESSMKLVAGADMQKMGSAVTYARRYTLGSLLSMQALDDDGEAVAERNAPKLNPAKTTPPKATAAEVKEVRAVNPDLGMTEAKAKVETKTDRPSFRRPAKAATTAPAAEASSGHGDDI